MDKMTMRLEAVHITAAGATAVLNAIELPLTHDQAADLARSVGREVAIDLVVVPTPEEKAAEDERMRKYYAAKKEREAIEAKSA